MIIRISDIGQDGLRINESIDPSWLTKTTDIVSNNEGNHLSSDIRFDLQVSKVLNEINVTGNISFYLESPCARCLMPVESDLKPKINLVLLPEVISEDDEENVDYETYAGDEIDLGGYLREIIAMSIPMRVLCKGRCRGLCQTCGVNLNLEDCGCEDNWVDPRFGALKNLKKSL